LTPPPAGFFINHLTKTPLKILRKILPNKVFTYLCHPEKKGSSLLVVTLALESGVS